MTLKPANNPWLLTQNSELREEGIYNWTLPAWVVQLDGRNLNVCPQAGACASLCYARNGTYLFPQVRAKHLANLRMVVDHLPAWEQLMTQELGHPRYQYRHVRVHDSGDFFTDAYLAAWLRIMRARPRVGFYAYTKEVSRFRRMVEPGPPLNFMWLYSMGGREDHLIDRSTDRHADVFPDLATLEAMGYSDQSESDLLAVYAPNHRVGIVANNIPHFRRRQAGFTFGELQVQRARHAPLRSGVSGADVRLGRAVGGGEA